MLLTTLDFTLQFVRKCIAGLLTGIIIKNLAFKTTYSSGITYERLGLQAIANSVYFKEVNLAARQFTVTVAIIDVAILGCRFKT